MYHEIAQKSCEIISLEMRDFQNSYIMKESIKYPSIKMVPKNMDSTRAKKYQKIEAE